MIRKHIVKVIFCVGLCISVISCQGQSNACTISCTTGKHCVIDANNQPTCVCDQVCPYTFDPVCGSDGITYSNECLLQQGACNTGTNVNVAYHGVCYAGSACAGFKCRDDQQCSVDESNHPVCVCVQNCPLTDDPVCGSDGKSYRNDCWLKKGACETNKAITLAYKGQCYTDALCQRNICPVGKKCAVNENNQTSCVCTEDCYTSYYPVCGSNSQTYDNMCLLQVAACKTNTRITVVHYGACGSGTICHGVFCPRGKHCEVDKTNRATCVCDQSCSQVDAPVCGSNNVTYANDCQFQTARCQSNNTISSSRPGRCEDGPGCFGVRCPFGKYCVADDQKRPKCVCSQVCSVLYEPVCGSDGVTYSNPCWVKVNSCLTNKNITTASRGPCQKPASSCVGVTCPAGKQCVTKDGQGATCVCNQACPRTYNLVCGTNAETYNNECLMQSAACLTNTTISVAYEGKCRNESTCNGITCASGKKCVVDSRGHPACVCYTVCTTVYDPICGNDGETYPNQCSLESKACLTSTNITMAHTGACENAISTKRP